MSEYFTPIDRHDGNVVLIFSEQLLIRFDIDFGEREAVANAGVLDRELRFLTQVTAGS